jgi:hypothetical protein
MSELDRALTLDEWEKRVRAGLPVTWLTVQDGDETYQIVVPSGALIFGLSHNAARPMP